MEQMDKTWDFFIGTSPQDLKMGVYKDSSLSVKNSFCGQINKFLVARRELNANEVNSILMTMNSKGPVPEYIPSSNPSAIQKLFKGKSEEIATLDQLEAEAILNLNTFSDLNKTEGPDIFHWTSFSNKNDKLIHNVVSLKNDPEKIKRSKTLDKPEKMYEILVQGVNYLEKSRVEDVFFSIGNIDILLYTIELLTSFEPDDGNKNTSSDNPRHILLCAIIQLIKYMCRSESQHIVIIFLRNGGFEIIGRLLYIVRNVNFVIITHLI